MAVNYGVIIHLNRASNRDEIIPGETLPAGTKGNGKIGGNKGKL